MLRIARTKTKSFGFELPVLTKESGKQRIAAVSSVESPLRRVRIRLRTPPSSLRKPRVSGTTPNRAFLRGFPATQFPDFGLCVRSRILVMIFGALSPHPKIPFPAAVVEIRSRQPRLELKGRPHGLARRAASQR